MVKDYNRNIDKTKDHHNMGLEGMVFLLKKLKF
jgi:hypothetical protein